MADRIHVLIQNQTGFFGLGKPETESEKELTIDVDSPGVVSLGQTTSVIFPHTDYSLTIDVNSKSGDLKATIMKSGPLEPGTPVQGPKTIVDDQSTILRKNGKIVTLTKVDHMSQGL